MTSYYLARKPEFEFGYEHLEPTSGIESLVNPPSQPEVAPGDNSSEQYQARS
jgi:hypothetical protein